MNQSNFHIERRLVMSKGIISTHGLKYTLSDGVYLMMEEKPELFDRLNDKVEASELLPSFVSVLVYIFLAISGTVSSWYMTIVYSMLSYFLATIVSMWATIFFIPLVTPILMVYQFLTKFFLHYVAIIIVSAFVMGMWYAGVVFVLASFIVGFVITISIGGNSQREVFYDAVAKKLYRKF